MHTYIDTYYVHANLHTLIKLIDQMKGSNPESPPEISVGVDHIGVEPVKLRFRLAVLNFSKIFEAELLLICPLITGV